MALDQLSRAALKELRLRVIFIELDNLESGVGILFKRDEKVFLIAPKHILIDTSAQFRAREIQLKHFPSDTDNVPTQFATIAPDDLENGTFMHALHVDLCALHVGDFPTEDLDSPSYIPSGITWIKRNYLNLHLFKYHDLAFSPTWDPIENIFLSSVSETETGLDIVSIAANFEKFDRAKFHLRTKHKPFQFKTGGPAYHIVRIGGSTEYFKLRLIGLIWYLAPVIARNENEKSDRAYTYVIPIDLLPELLDNFFYL